MKLNHLKECIIRTLKKPFLDRELVICACNKLSLKIAAGEFNYRIMELGLGAIITEQKLAEASLMLSEEYLRKKVAAELGSDESFYYPWGVLFHIGAGNMDGLSAFSVIEGLLMGNINLLKMPSKTDQITLVILNELIQIEPDLKEYIYIFHITSSQTNKIKRLCELADVVVIWGSDRAIKAVRELVPPNTKLIEWGHKISFAYITSAGINEEQLMLLANHIVETKQLLCSSCQGIYIDSKNDKFVGDFCKRFLTILEKAAVMKSGFDIGIRAQNALKLYNYEIENPVAKNKIYKTKNVSVIHSYDLYLENSLLNGNIWVKSLPADLIIDTLRDNRGYLQTVGLMCLKSEHKVLESLFIKAGLTRLRMVGDMSKESEGNAHDGEYSLRRYGKVIKESV